MTGIYDRDGRRRRGRSFAEMHRRDASAGSALLFTSHDYFQGSALFGGKMQKRYFVLYDNRELHYFEGSSMDNIVRKGRIHLQQARSPRDQREIARKMPPRLRSAPPTIAI